MFSSAVLSPHACANAQQQIQQALGQYMQQLLSDEAHRQGWHGLRHSIEINKSTSSQALAPCSQALQIDNLGGGSALARQKLQVRCPDTPGWNYNTTVQAEVYLPMVQAIGLIERGATIDASQLKLSEAPLEKSNRGFYQSLEQVVGQSAKRRIRASQVISPALLSAATAVRRGEQVTIRASHDGINASTGGQALADGRIGEIIRVRNVSSEKVIDAKVIEAGVVSSTFD